MRTNSDFGGHSSNDPELDQVTSASLRQLFPTATFFQCEDVIACDLAVTGNQMHEGAVCVFRNGEDEPVEFAAMALASGASAILTDQLLPCPLPQVIVGDVEMAASELMNELAGRPSQQLMMIGVVGTAGKTTTALMIAGMLRGLGIRTAYETDLGSSDGIVQSVDVQKVPRGAALVQRLADARDSGCGAAVVELSSEVAAAHSGIALDLLIVTGSTTNSGHWSAQAQFGPDPLTVALENLAPDGVVVVPADHPRLVRHVDDTGHKRMTYGLRREAELSAKVFDNQPGETTLQVSCGDETAMMETKHCGEAMAMNQLAAIAVAMLLETPLCDAIERVCQLPVVPGRMQRITGFDSAAIVLDAGGDGSRIATTLRTLRQQRCGGKLWCVMTLEESAAGVRDDSAAICGRLIERYADRVVLTSTDENKPNFLQSAHGVLDGFREVTVARLVADRQCAIQWAVQNAAPNDTILVLGGVDGANAHARRSRIQSLESLVLRCQGEPSVKRVSRPATIKIYG